MWWIEVTLLIVTNVVANNMGVLMKNIFDMFQKDMWEFDIISTTTKLVWVSVLW
jgi:hypothetical protein